MNITKSIVLGAQWGDEGKGKIVDLLSEKADVTVRFNGGHNAGHTVYVGPEKKKIVLHIVPSGIFNDSCLCFIGCGAILNLEKLYNEIKTIEETNIRKKSVAESLRISSLTPLILPWHIALDKARDAVLGIGTTAQGNGPAYEDRPGRRTIRYGELFEFEYDKLLEKMEVSRTHAIKSSPSGQLITCFAKDALDDLIRFRDIMMIRSIDIASELAMYKSNSFVVVFEGAQGSLLDVDHGTLPYVTSSTTLAGGACSGAGVPPTYFREIFGVAKAYVTRVGGGYLPTELQMNEPGTPGYMIQTIGNEIGATTGRVRRCGWLDIPALRRAVLLNGFTGLIITKLDVLNGFDKIKICASYLDKKTGNSVRVMPEFCSQDRYIPFYEEVNGWDSATNNNVNLLNYVSMISKLTGVPVVLCSTGPNKNDVFEPWIS